MGNVKKIGNQIIVIGQPDHGPPHAHIIGGGVRISISLIDFSTKGNTKGANKAINWVKANSAKLIKIYNELNG
ncbi:MAG: hypothetical protein HQL69_24235 [Magnetococcales bacterium]|nr:hypothetical protein [Magnetococcales bacterium]